MSDIDAADMSHIGPKKDIARERVARAWHEGSDHAADEPFGGPLCNCWQVAERMLPMLSEAWLACADEARDCGYLGAIDHEQLINRDPYETGDRHVDQ